MVSAISCHFKVIAQPIGSLQRWCQKNGLHVLIENWKRWVESHTVEYTHLWFWILLSLIMSTLLERSVCSVESGVPLIRPGMGDISLPSLYDSQLWLNVVMNGMSNLVWHTFSEVESTVTLVSFQDRNANTFSIARKWLKSHFTLLLYYTSKV